MTERREAYALENTMEAIAAVAGCPCRTRCDSDRSRTQAASRCRDNNGATACGDTEAAVDGVRQRHDAGQCVSDVWICCLFVCRAHGGTEFGSAAHTDSADTLSDMEGISKADILPFDGIQHGVLGDSFRPAVCGGTNGLADRTGRAVFYYRAILFCAVCGIYRTYAVVHSVALPVSDQSCFCEALYRDTGNSDAVFRCQRRPAGHMDSADQPVFVSGL